MSIFRRMSGSLIVSYDLAMAFNGCACRPGAWLFKAAIRLVRWSVLFAGGLCGRIAEEPSAYCPSTEGRWLLLLRALRIVTYVYRAWRITHLQQHICQSAALTSNRSLSRLTHHISNSHFRLQVANATDRARPSRRPVANCGRNTPNSSASRWGPTTPATLTGVDALETASICRMRHVEQVSTCRMKAQDITCSPTAPPSRRAGFMPRDWSQADLRGLAIIG